jgi:hypothetical protein
MLKQGHDEQYVHNNCATGSLAFQQHCVFYRPSFATELEGVGTNRGPEQSFQFQFNL